MLISCPKCKSVYEIEPNIVPPHGRKMVCSECGEKFLCHTSDALIEHFINMENAFGQGESFAGKKTSDSKKNDKKYGKTLLLIILSIFLAIFIAIFMLRQEITKRFPDMERLCDLAHINCLYVGHNIEFRDVHSQYFINDGRKMIQITGQIYNYGDYTVMVPDVELQILDGNRNVVQEHIQKIDLNRLESHETLLFKIVTEDPDIKNQAVYVIFSEK